MPVALDERLRSTGIDVIGEVPWGSHFCQFYKTKEDLIEILVPYFAAGLQNNEYCMWVTSEPLDENDAREALREAVPDLDRYLGNGQLAILPYGEWYVKDGCFDSQRVLKGWVDRLEQALARGFDGLRLTGNTFWLEQTHWRDFTDYEESVNEVIDKYRMVAICTYCLDKCGASEVIDVIRNHQFALIRRDNRWETVESTERRRLGEALVASEQRFRSIVETAREGIWLVDDQGRTTFVNGEMAAMLGNTVEEMLGQPQSAYLDGEARVDGVWGLERRIQGPAERYDVKFRRRDGTDMWAIVSATPVFDKEGRQDGALHMVTDITERKEMERRLVEANEELQAQSAEIQRQSADLQRRATELAAANAELEAFSYSASHDLRAPLRAINGFSQALLKDHAGELDDQGKRYLNRICAASETMGQLIDDLLALSRLTRSEMRYQEVDLSAASTEIAGDLRRSEPGRKVEFDIARNVTAQGDARLLRIALENLLGNAWKFTAKHPAAKIEFGIAEHDGKRAYYVRDDGAGFDMAYAGKLFGAFQRLHGAGEFPGSGIGLATVQRIIHRHGGQVWAEGAVERGAAFYFSLG